MKKTFFLTALFFSVFLQVGAQEIQTQHTEKVWRINFLNSGVEYEFPTEENFTFSASLGLKKGISQHSSNEI